MNPDLWCVCIDCSLPLSLPDHADVGQMLNSRLAVLRSTREAWSSSDPKVREHTLCLHSHISWCVVIDCSGDGHQLREPVRPGGHAQPSALEECVCVCVCRQAGSECVTGALSPHTQNTVDPGHGHHRTARAQTVTEEQILNVSYSLHTITDWSCLLVCRYVVCGCKIIKLILKSFGPVIKANISLPPSSGVDISRERGVCVCVCV